MLLRILELRLDLLAFVVVALATMCGLHWRLRRLTVHQGLSRRIWITGIGLVLLAGIAAEWMSVRERRRLTGMVGGFAPTYALEMMRGGHAQLSLDTPPEDPVYLALIQKQLQWLKVNPAVNDIYTFRQKPDGSVILVVDSETDYDRNGVFEGDTESRTAIGEVFDDLSPPLAKAFSGVVTFDDVPYSDRWGTWVSAFAPLVDENGRIDGVLGVDYEAGAWVVAILSARGVALGTVTILLLLMLASATVVAVMRAEIQDRIANEKKLKESEQQLRSFAATLQETNWKLEESRRAAEAAAEAKSAFLANMSHEIRTPLTGILGYADLLQRHADNGDEQVRTEWLGTIQLSGRHLLQVVNDVLDLAKFDSGRLVMERVSCCPQTLLEETAAILRSQSAAKGLTLRIEPTDRFTILADPARLRQLLVNLVGNAVKFTSTGEIVLGVRREPVANRPDRPNVAFVVRDTGIGIPPDKLHTIFAPFEQADVSVTRKFGGTGLGLSISKRITQALGGDIRVTSELGVGSVFTATIDPQAITEAPDRTASQASAPTSNHTVTGGEENTVCLRGKRVLLVDDGETNRRVLRIFLQRAKAQVDLAENGREAIEAALVTNYDLILMDVQMPVLDGLAATRELRTMGIRTPVIALTANAQREDEQRCHQAGCSSYLTKPVTGDTLLSAVATCLNLPRVPVTATASRPALT